MGRIGDGRIEQDNTLLDKIITAGLPSEAWKIPLSMVGDERSEAAQDKGKRYVSLQLSTC